MTYLELHRIVAVDETKGSFGSAMQFVVMLDGGHKLTLDKTRGLALLNLWKAYRAEHATHEPYGVVSV